MLAQQRKSRSPIHHLLDELDPGHLSVVMRACQSHEGSGFVAFQISGKAVQFRDVAGHGRAEKQVPLAFSVHFFLPYPYELVRKSCERLSTSRSGLFAT